jgi:hypothetical protein
MMMTRKMTISTMAPPMAIASMIISVKEALKGKGVNEIDKEVTVTLSIQT